MKTYIGADNGTSGSLGIISPDGTIFEPMPTMKVRNYQKEEKYITRIDWRKVMAILKDHRENSIAILEQPMVNPNKFNASTSALRAFESILIVLESLGIPYKFIYSKEWQKALLPGVKGETKDESRTVGLELFPSETWTICQQGDADGLLIAEYARRNNW